MGLTNAKVLLKNPRLPELEGKVNPNSPDVASSVAMRALW